MKKRNVLVFVWNYLDWGGAQIYLFAIIKVAVKTWDVIVILPTGSAPGLVRLLDELGVQYRFVGYHLDMDPATTLRRKLTRQLTRIKVEYAMYKTLLEFDVRDTVFHIDIAPWQSVAFLTAMSLRGAKVFISIHNFHIDAPWWRSAIWKSRLGFDSRLPGLNFLTSNKDTKKRLRGWVTDKFWDRIRIAVTSIDPKQIADASEAPFDREKTLRDIGVPPDDFVVLCVGQFIDRKGRWIFLEAARELMKSSTSISFVWLTPRPPSPEDQKRIDAYELGEKFRLVLSETAGTTR